MARAEESRFPLTPQRIVSDVRKVMPADGIVALDNGMYKIWFARCYRTRNANALLLDNALATMGAGLPSAMMAAMLNPGKRVMAVCGDGGFMMNSQELETAVRLKLDLVVLIIQDDAYGMIRWKQAVDSFTDFGLSFGNPDFVKYAEAYGAKGRRVESAEALVVDPRSGVRRRRRAARHGAGGLQRERPRARRRAAQQGPRGGGMKTRAAVLREIGLPAPVQPVEAARDRGSRARAARAATRCSFASAPRACATRTCPSSTATARVRCRWRSATRRPAK